MGILREIGEGIGSLTYNTFGKDIITGREKDNAGIYIGYDSNNGISISTPYFGPNQYKLGGQGYTSKPRPNSGYSRTTAATAKDIAQGGMTKDEVIEFNMKHPNETAKRSE